jgi:hypothetical protein
MKRFLLVCLLSAALVSFASLPPANGCAVARKKDDTVRIASEQALIIWDEKTKTEHFIRRANFDTTALYIGFLVPTPTQPKVADAPDSTFAMLGDWSKPETRTEVEVRYHSLFDVMAPATKGERNAEMAKAAGGVDVIERSKVGSGEYAILWAKKGASDKVMEWLQKNSFEIRPELKDWLTWYVDHEWYLTVFKFERGARPGTGLSPESVRISFKAERPFYPYREPEDARKPANEEQQMGERRFGGEQRALRVFFVANGRYKGNLGKDGAWPGKAEHAKPLTEEQLPKLTKGIASKKKDVEQASVPEGAWLTVFDDLSSPRPGTDEVYFSKDDNQTELGRPPIIRYEYVDRIYPSELVGLGLFVAIVVLGGVYIVWRFGFRQAG